MAEFGVFVTKLSAVREHSNADRLEIAEAFGFPCIVKKGDFEKGDLVAYIPEGSVLPDDLLEEMGLTGRLSGSGKNRVKAVKLRGELSQGLVLKARPGWQEGDDVAEDLKVTKFIEPVPAKMGGDVWHAGSERTLKYDIENWKKYKNVIKDGEPVVMTEKAHGTFSAFSFGHEPHPTEGDVAVFSKGRGARGLALRRFPKREKTTLARFIEKMKREDIDRHVCEVLFYSVLFITFLPIAALKHGALAFSGLALLQLMVGKPFLTALIDRFLYSLPWLLYRREEKKEEGRPANESNCYIQIYNRFEKKFRKFEETPFFEEDQPYFILGETFGSGVQDMTYGMENSHIDFRVFDVYVGKYGTGRYLNDDELSKACDIMGVPRVPVVYRGPFSVEKLKEATIGRELISGKGVHIREGVVVRPRVEREDRKLGRVQLKSVSEDYLSRKGGTERN